MDKPYIILANAIDPIFLNPHKNMHVCYLKNTGVELLFAGHSPRLIPLSFTKKHRVFTNIFEDTVFSATDIADKLREYNIRSIIGSHILTTSFIRAAKKADVKILSLPERKQRILNNKIRFHDLMDSKGASLPLRIKNYAEIKKSRLYVVQNPSSYGMQGTFFFKGSEVIDKKIFSRRNTFVREYLPGEPLGISIFINEKGSYFFSAIRKQCFRYIGRLPNNFLGIQWLPHAYFSRQSLRRLEDQMEKVVGALKALEVSGSVAVDFLLYKENIYLLECNPRLSSASPHIFGGFGLTDNVDPWDYYIRAITHTSTTSVLNKSLPVSNFEGSVLDVDILGKLSVSALPKAGVYEYGKNIVWIGSDIKKLHINKPRFLLYHEIHNAPTTWKDFTLCSVISNFPLFNAANGSMNSAGLKIYNHCKRLFL